MLLIKVSPELIIFSPTIRSHFHVIFGRISAEISAELSVNLAEISVSAETDFSRFGRSLLNRKSKSGTIPPYLLEASERPKRQKSVSAETEISATLTETSAEISAEIRP